MFDEDLKKFDSQIEFHMFYKADAEWSMLHEPLAGTSRPFHLGGNIDEIAVINDYKNFDSRINVEYVHYLFEKWEAEGKGKITKGTTWSFKFNKHLSIYSSLDEPWGVLKQKRRKRWV